MATTLLWIQAALTIALLSIVFKDNGFYKFSEHLYVGLYAGYTVVVTYFNYLRPSSRWITQDGKYYYLIPVVLGLLIYTRYIKGIQWLARYNMAFIVGVGSGLVLARDFKSLVLDQVRATFKPLYVAGDLLSTVDNLIIIIGVSAVLWYFLFTVQKKGTAGRISGIGRMVMMVAFGSAFGNTVMSRVSLFLGRMQFLLGDWLKLID